MDISPPLLGDVMAPVHVPQSPVLLCKDLRKRKTQKGDHSNPHTNVPRRALLSWQSGTSQSVSQGHTATSPSPSTFLTLSEGDVHQPLIKLLDLPEVVDHFSGGRVVHVCEIQSCLQCQQLGESGNGFHEQRTLAGWPDLLGRSLWNQLLKCSAGSI